MNHRVTISTVCRTVLAVSVLSLAACSSGGGDSTSAYRPVATADTPGIVAAGDCAAAREVAAALASIDPTDAAGLTALPDSVRSLHDVVPAELQGSVGVVGDALDTFVGVLRRFDFDAAKVDADPAAKQELDALDTPEVSTAIADLQAWLDESCTGSSEGAAAGDPPATAADTAPDVTTPSGTEVENTAPVDGSVPEVVDPTPTTAVDAPASSVGATGSSIAATDSSAAPTTVSTTIAGSGTTSTATTVERPTPTTATPTVTTARPTNTTVKPVTTTTRPAVTTTTKPPATTTTTPGSQSFTVDAANPSPPVFRVALGTDITLVVNSVTDQEFHLHDIDLTIGGTHVTFRFTADLPGTHIVESHDTGKLVCTFVIG